MRKTNTNHFYGLDYLRAISCILIVLYHYTTRYDETIGLIEHWPFSLPWGCWAVNTFFMLTGFLTIWGINIGGRQWKRYGQFLYKRCIRLYPTFWACIVITTFVVAVFLPGKVIGLKDILLNFTMFPSYLGAEYVDGAYWTLSIEMLFYLLVVCFSLIAGKKSFKISLYVWMTLTMGYFICVNAGITNIITRLISLFFLAGKRNEFLALGAIIAFVIEEKQIIKYIPLIAICYINAYFECGFVFGTIWMFLGSSFIWASVKYCDKIRLKDSNPIHKILVYVSEISYPIYLLHQLIGFAIINKLQSLGLVSEFGIIVPTIIVVILASTINKWIYQPISKQLSNILQRKENGQNT